MYRSVPYSSVAFISRRVLVPVLPFLCLITPYFTVKERNSYLIGLHPPGTPHLFETGEIWGKGVSQGKHGDYCTQALGPQ